MRAAAPFQPVARRVFFHCRPTTFGTWGRITENRTRVASPFFLIASPTPPPPYSTETSGTFPNINSVASAF